MTTDAQVSTQVEQQQVDAQADTSQGTQQTANEGSQSNEAEEAAQGQEQQVDAQTEDQQQQERDEKGRFKGVQPRIDELTRARREAEREAAYWRQVAAQHQGANQSGNQPAPKPTPDQFSDYGEYVEALTDWKAEQAVAKRMEQDSARKVVETRAQTFEQRMAEARKTIADFDDVVMSSTTPLATHVGEALQESEHGPALAYHFAKNPDVLMRLNSMDEKAANREIGRLEATLTSRTTAAPPPAPTKKVTQAPTPAGTLGTQGRATTPPLANASMDEYMAQRKAQGARWAR